VGRDEQDYVSTDQYAEQFIRQVEVLHENETAKISLRR
jgi:hypothetical protein